MKIEHCKNIILLGSSGSIAKGIKSFLKKDFENHMFIDIKPTSEMDKNEKDFFLYDLSLGLPLEAFDFIEKNHKTGITLINTLGEISSKSFLTLNSNKENYQNLFKEQNTFLKNDFQRNFSIPISVSTQFANIIVSFRGSGSIINFSSVSSHGNQGQLGYSSMKGALEIATKVLAREFGPLGIRFNSIAPGFIDTKSMRENMHEKGIRDIISKTSLKRLGKVEDIYSTIYMLINCNFINGQTIRVDGNLVI